MPGGRCALVLGAVVVAVGQPAANTAHASSSDGPFAIAYDRGLTNANGVMPEPASRAEWPVVLDSDCAGCASSGPDDLVGRLSSWSCHGIGTREQAAARLQSCLFRDVELAANGTLILYLGQGGPVETAQHKLRLLALSPNAKVGQPFCASYLRMRRGAVTLNPKKLRSDTKWPNGSEPLSTESEWTERDPNDQRACLEIIAVEKLLPTELPRHPASVAMFYEPFAPENFGHFLYDDLFVSIGMMADFGMLSMASQWIVRRPCQFVSTETQWARCMQRYTQWLPLVSNFTLLSTQSTKKFGLQVGKPLPGRTIFRRLVAGRGFNPFIHGMAGRSTLWASFRAHVLRQSGVWNRQNQKVTEQLILVANKSAPARRGFVNFSEIIERLKKIGPNVRVLNPHPGLTLKEELKMVQSATVFITPCGGVSMSSAFLRPRTAALYFDYFSTENQPPGPKHMEAEAWESLGSFESHYYAVSRAEVVQNNLGSRHWWYKPDVERLAFITMQLLCKIELVHGLPRRFCK